MNVYCIEPGKYTDSILYIPGNRICLAGKWIYSAGIFLRQA